MRALLQFAESSEKWAYVPAWVVPSFANAGLSFASDSYVVPARMPSSLSTMMSFPSSVFGSTHSVFKERQSKDPSPVSFKTRLNGREGRTFTGTISSLNQPWFCACSARRNDSAANRSCSSLVIP